MKILSYNIYGVKDTIKPIPTWQERQKNIEQILNNELRDSEIKVCCFQEVNQNNIELLKDILKKNNFQILNKFAMKTQSYPQYNIIAIRNNQNIILENTYCLPHGKDLEYKVLSKQRIDYQMSDYRTTVFVYFKYKSKKYLIGNIHTDYISTKGKEKGVEKSLNYMDTIEADYKIVLGDMNMISHMSEVYNILKQNPNYITLSRSKNFNESDNSWHGYGTKEQVNVDFAFVEKSKINIYDYKIIKQDRVMQEGSDHRPIIVSVN